MSFKNREESRFKGEPVDLFYFRYGSTPNAFYAYTDAEQEITFDGVTYTPATFKRANVTSSGTLDKSTLNLNCPQNLALVDLFRIYPPAQVVTVIIRAGHIDDPANDFKVIFTGRVLNCSRDGGEAELSCEPVSTSMKRTGLRRHYQISCPHDLYGSRCKANKLNATSQHEIVNLQGDNKFRLADGWNGDISAKKYIGGMVEWVTANGRESRTILRVTDGTQIVLAGPTRGLAPGSVVDMILGCNHAYIFQDSPPPEEDEDDEPIEYPGTRDHAPVDQEKTDCIALHDNIHNFGGCPWIPTENPINKNPFN